MALTRSIELERAGYTVDLQTLDLGAARAAGDPELSISVGSTVRYARGYETDFFGNPGEDGPDFQLITEGEVSRGLNSSLQLSLPLFDGGSRSSSRRAAERALDAGRMRRDRTAEDVASQAAVGYLQSLQAEALVTVEESSLEAGRMLLERVEAEFEAGNRNLVDVLQQRAAIALGEQRLAVARRNDAVARLQLRQLLRLPRGATLELAPAPENLPGLPSEAMDVALLVDRALEERTDLAAWASTAEATRLDVRAARAGRFPTVTLSGTAGTSYNSLDVNRGFDRQLSDVNPSASVGLSLSFPVFDGGRNGRAVERARVSVADADAMFDAERHRVATAVETAALDVEAAAARLAAGLQAASAAREALAASEARYGVGAGIFLDVLDARRTLVQAETDVVSAQYDLLTSRILLAHETGGLGDLLVDLD